MDLLQLVAGIIGIVASIPLLFGIYKNKVELNFAAFMLWALLDAIAAITIILQHGNYKLVLGYAFSASIVAISLAIKKQVKWSWIETLTTGLVVICLFIWYKSGDKAGTIVSSLAVIIASIPQIIETFLKPEKTPTG